jgi:hypothetical protein
MWPATWPKGSTNATFASTFSRADEKPSHTWGDALLLTSMTLATCWVALAPLQPHQPHMPRYSLALLPRYSRVHRPRYSRVHLPRYSLPSLSEWLSSGGTGSR